MAWFKVDENFDTHPRMLGLSGDAIATWLRALAYCNRHATDGLIPGKALRLVESHADGDTTGELVEAGLWLPTSDGWQIRDFLDWNRSKAERDELSEKRSEAGRRGGKARAKQLAGNLPSNGQATSKQSPSNTARPDTEADTEQSRNTKPFVSTKAETSPKKSKKAPVYTDDFKAFWSDYPRHPKSGALGGGGSKVEAWGEWVKLDDVDQRRAREACGPYARLLRKSDTPPKHACRFLKYRQFDDVHESSGPRLAPVGDLCEGCNQPLDAHDQGWHDQVVAS